MSKRFNAIQWVEHEIDDQADLYSQPRQRAAVFVLDLLNEGQYEELTPKQCEQCKVACREAINECLEYDPSEQM